MKRSPGMDRQALLELGIAVHRVGDVYTRDREGRPLSAAEQARWFVSALVGTLLADAVGQIPETDSEDAAWTLAARHVAAALAAADGAAGQP